MVVDETAALCLRRLASVVPAQWTVKARWRVCQSSVESGDVGERSAERDARRIITTESRHGRARVADAARLEHGWGNLEVPARHSAQNASSRADRRGCCCDGTVLTGMVLKSRSLRSLRNVDPRELTCTPRSPGNSRSRVTLC